MSIVDCATLEKAAHVIRQGGLVGMPTETVYGLAGDATNDQSVAKIFAAKNRPQFNPLIAHMANLDMAQQYAAFSPLALRLAKRFWPGALTLVLPRKNPPATKDDISLLASAGLDTLALRSPAHPMAQALIAAADRPLAAPSANPSGRVSPTTAAHVYQGLGAKVDLILDGGSCEIGIESTIIKIIDNEAVLLRPGGLSRTAIETCLRKPLLTNRAPKTVEAPGALKSHYAPSVIVRLNVAEPSLEEAYLALGEEPDHPHSLNLSAAGNLTEAAANLFTMLHRLDRLCHVHQLKAIAVAPIPDHGLGEAINDRLTRAAAPRK